MRQTAVLVVTVLLAAACGGSSSPASPSNPQRVNPLPVISETDRYIFHADTGDTVDSSWQEAYHQWAIDRLGVRPDRKIGYYKYRTRQDMGVHTGNYNTNGYADPATFEIHTLWPTDNHEVVHLYMSLVGQSTALFSEGIAVAFQTDPPRGIFDSVFNGEEVHHAARRYLDAGQLVLPLERIIESTGFRAVPDSVLSYREAGSFVRFLVDRYGLQAVLALFRAGGSVGDSAQMVKTRFSAAFGATVEEAEAEWLTMLRARTGG
jgi:hypothetical protein